MKRRLASLILTHIMAVSTVCTSFSGMPAIAAENTGTAVTSAAGEAAGDEEYAEGGDVLTGERDGAAQSDKPAPAEEIVKEESSGTADGTQGEAAASETTGDDSDAGPDSPQTDPEASPEAESETESEAESEAGQTNREATPADPEEDNEAGIEEGSAAEPETDPEASAETMQEAGQPAARVEDALEQEAGTGRAYATAEKVIDFGGEGVVKKQPMETVPRTNGFADDVIDISTGKIWVTLEGGKEIELGSDVFEASGKYQKVNLTLSLSESRRNGIELPSNVSDDLIVNEENNGVQYMVTGPGVKKELKAKAYDSECFISGLDTCEKEADSTEYFVFDFVSSDRMMKWLKMPADNDLMTDIHSEIYFTVTSYDLDELRKYGSAREFVEAKSIMQNDDEYTKSIGSENEILKEKRCRELGKDVDAYCREAAEKNLAAGYKYDVKTYYSAFIVIDENSQDLDRFLAAAEAGDFAAFAHKDGKYWFGRMECRRDHFAENIGVLEADKWLKNTFGDKIPDHETVIAPYDCKEYSCYYAFTNRDVINAWLNEMENWDGHWTYLLYGEASVPELNSDDTVPGYEHDNWIVGPDDQAQGKVKVHHPETYTFYVKDPGVYTLTATIDGCEGVAKSTFRVARPLDSCTVSGIKDKVYTGKKQTQSPVVKDGGKTLVNGKDYEISYKDNVNAGFSFFTITGKGDYYGTYTDYFLIKAAPAKITAANIVRSYSASAQKFAIGAKAAGCKLSYKTGSKKVTVSKSGQVTLAAGFYGTTWIDITATGKNYTKATRRITVRVPLRTSIGAVKSYKSGNMTVKWKRDPSVSGYQIRYCRTVMFANNKYVTINNNAVTTRTIGKLARGKVYYVQIRSFKTVGGKKYYSRWSVKRKVTTKK